MTDPGTTATLMPLPACDTVVAMSGGVDSSVAALLSVRSGRRCAGATLRLWDDDEGARLPSDRCCAPRDIRDARLVASRLDMPHYVLDMREAFTGKVVRPFVQEYLRGRTPLPCAACNSDVKFADLLRWARAVGAGALVTGHYARLVHEDGRVKLLRARDRGRDQSYFLHGLTQEQLAFARFPLGEMSKDDVRALAADARLPVAAKPDSQEVCFVGDGRTGAFVERQALTLGLPVRPGPIVDTTGHVVGRHEGIHRFTVGQRKGLGAHGARRHVVSIEPATATVVAGSATDLECSALRVSRFHWLAGEPPRGGPLAARVQVRHGLEATRAFVEPTEGSSVHVVFTEPARAVAPGQAAVVYVGDEVLGGGPIDETTPWR